MPKYLVTVTETYYVDADNEEDAITMADSLRPCVSHADAEEIMAEELP